MALLHNTEIQARLVEPVISKRLFITPLLDPSAQIGKCSIDVRLGNEFIVTQQTNIADIDLARRDSISRNIGRYQELVRVDFGEPFILHPNHLVLASTLEYIGIPVDVAAQVEGRSSWGRLGLIIATATSIAPGFKGAVTLELVNLGMVPLSLYPGLVIAQILLYNVGGDSDYEGRYSYPTGPQFSRIHKDSGSEFWTEPKNFSDRF